VSPATAAYDVFRAVADPTRRALLEKLRLGELSVSELQQPFRMSQPAISQHIRILRRAGLVRARRDGRRQIYRLETAPFEQLYRWAGQFRVVADRGGHLWVLREPGGPKPAARGRGRR